MPEGPEVETIRRTLEKRFCGQEIESIWRSEYALRTPTNNEDFRFLTGDRVAALFRVGKMLMVETNRRRGLFVHFGMSGRLFYPQTLSPLEKHTHLRIQLKSSAFELRFIDPRRFGDVKPYRNEIEKMDALKKLGPDGIDLSTKDIKALIAKIRKSHRPIKAVLLDQSVISGVGNIYACEALHQARISPLRLACDLTKRETELLLLACKEVMTKAVANGGTTFMSYLDSNGDKGSNQDHLHVFGKTNEPCPLCTSKIIRIEQSGRSTFYCNSCQL